MKPTRALLDGVLKYKRLFGSFEKVPENHFLYDEQTDVLNFVAGSSDLSAFQTGTSIECQVMDWADDIAYALGDVVDGVRARFITVDRLEAWGRDEPNSCHAELEQLARNVRAGTLTRFAALKIGEFIAGCSLTAVDGPVSRLSARYKYALKREEKVNKANKFYRRIAPALVFGTPQVQQLEYKGAQILRSLFQLFRSEYFSVTNADRKPHLLPRDLEERIFNLPCAAKDERARLICDHLAGMSDDFAIRTYRRIFEADYGSIVDLV